MRMPHNLPESQAHGPVRITCDADKAFADWIVRSGGSLIISTYQAGKVAAVGWDGERVTLLMRQFDKPLGMAIDGRRMALATRHDICLMANAPALAGAYLPRRPEQSQRAGQYDALYLPRVTYHTGDLNTHDLAFAGDDLILVNTRFSCLSRLSSDFSFEPIWRPPFISDVVPEDRCHLNGLAMAEGRAKYVTALGTTDTAGAWRERKATGGVVVDVETGEIVLDGLAMPHSPRWHDGRLWLLNSGAGEVLRFDPESGQMEVVCCLPGYLRGLCFVGPYALVGLCKIREKHIFGGLPIQERCKKLLSGVAVVDLRTGVEVGMFEFTAGCEELFEVRFLPQARRPMILNLDRPAARQAMTIPECSFWLRPEGERREMAAAESHTAENPAMENVSGGQLNFQNVGEPLSASAGGVSQHQMGNAIPDTGN